MKRNFAACPEQCPESRQTVYYPQPRCNLNDKICLLETEGECPTYEDWLFEQRQEELDHPDWLFEQRQLESIERFHEADLSGR